MGFFSNLFGSNKNKTSENIASRDGQPDVHFVASESERMNWAIEKAGYTLHYFEESLRNPGPNQNYFSIKVKIVDGDHSEHIWLVDPEFDSEGNLFGTVGNEPLNVKSVKMDQRIGINRSLVSDWMILEKGRLIGGYTIRAIRDGIKKSDLKAFDAQLGGMFIDEGEDYFKPDFTTPEGAILSLENAYDEGDLEKAMACKDFDAEATLMLQKLKKDFVTPDIIAQTAELLRLSFIKHLEGQMPSFKNVKRAFPLRQKISDNECVITEVCYYPDGSKSTQKLSTFLSENGWRVLGTAD